MFSIQMDAYARFRIVYKFGKSGEIRGEWVDYRSIAILCVDGKTYVAGSAYGLFPKSEQVYELTAIPTKIDHSWDKKNSRTGKRFKPIKIQ